MTKLPKELVDLVVTSPPYNIGKEYEEEFNNRCLCEMVTKMAGWYSENLSPQMELSG